MILHWLTGKIISPANGFNAATEHEPIVFGARRPGFPFHPVKQEIVNLWIAFMIGQDIQRVVCLLPKHQLGYYDDLLGSYRNALGTQKVCWAPIEDFHLADVAMLTELVLPFLADADQRQEKTVIHCSGGIGRTGHVLATWLVSFRGMSNTEAIETVKRSGRNARESRDKDLDELLNACRSKFADKHE